MEEEVGDELHGAGEVAGDLVFVIFNVTFVSEQLMHVGQFHKVCEW